MLTVEDNKAMTSVGADTAMGQLLRRYWYPIAGTVELDDEPTKEVRLLGEDLVLYKDLSGTYGLLGRACPHRRISLLYGIPEENGLRCVYHGWLWDAQGRCLEQPAEPTGSTFKERVRNVARTPWRKRAASSSLTSARSPRRCCRTGTGSSGTTWSSGSRCTRSTAIGCR